jgi:hypothetical protein
VSFTGSPDLGTAVALSSGRVRRAFGGGPYVVEPSGCEVLASGNGDLLWELDLARALVERESRATVSCTVGAQYAEEEALRLLRETDPGAAVTPCILTDWVFRVTPTPALSTAWDVTTPVPMTSAGLGTGRLILPLSLESGLLLERLLRDGGSLSGTAEATLSGVSPRVPAVVRFDPAVLVDQLLTAADTSGALPYELLVAAFRRDPADLPLDLSGTVDGSTLDAFAHTMADRIVDRSGCWLPAQDPVDAPVVRLTPSDPGMVMWSLSQPVLVQRRILLQVDLLGAARRQAAERGLDSLVTRRDLASLPSMGSSAVTVLCTLPASRSGAEVLGVGLEFPPYLPARPQPRWATAVLEHEDLVQVQVRLAPDEPLRYLATPFAVVADEAGTRRLEGATTEVTGPVLRLGPDEFPVELAACAFSPALAKLAVVSGVCSYEREGQVRERRFALDSGQLETAVVVPRDRAWLRIDVVATARDGSGELTLGPFEAAPVRLDLGSFPTYGPQQVTVRCVFDDASLSRAVTLLPAGAADAPENATTVVLTPQEPVRTHRWFAPSPFADGIRYRPYGDGGAWSRHRPADGELVLFSSELGRREARRTAPRAVVVRERQALLPTHRRTLRVTEAVLAGREAVEAEAVTEAAVVPVATSPAPVPTDELVYARTDPPGGQGFVPRYELAMQTVSGRPEYRISMDTTAATSTLTVQLLATAPPSVLQEAPAATELPHTLGVTLEFLLIAGGGATKTLEFTDVTRSGTVVAAELTFATLAERDDVYGALTDPARGARLVVRRRVDLLVPVRGLIGAVFELPIAISVLPERPLVAWPPRRIPVADPLPGRDGDPIIVAPILTAGPDAALVTSTIATPQLRLDPLPTKLFTGVPVTPAREHSARLLEMRRRDDDGGGPIWVDDDPPDPGPEPDPGPVVATLPVPRLSLNGRDQEPGLTRFRLGVENWQEFSDDFFAAAPDLPPCGANANASRTWVDILDAGSGITIYGFCALGAAQQLTDLWFAVTDGGAVPAEVQVRLTDRRTGVGQLSNAVATAVPEPPPPPDPTYVPVRQELQQAVAPEPFAFSPVLHGYIFQGLTPGSGANRLVRHMLPYGGRSHSYLQDASRPWVVYVFPDEFKIARRTRAPFTPFATVRVRSSAEGGTAGVVFDYVVAPHVDPERLVEARARLLADPRFGADSVEFQPFTTNDVSFTVDRPTESGSVREQRPDAAIVLQGALKDTLTMPLGDFRLLFNAMHGSTASLFVGHVDIGIGNDPAEVVPFTARMDDLEGPVFQWAVTSASDGLLDVRLTNCIESPLDVQTLGVTLMQDDQVSRGLVRGGLPLVGLRPGESTVVRVEPESLTSASPSLELILDLTGVTVHPDAAAIWNSILDRTTVDYFRVVTVKALRTLFDLVPGHEAEQIRVIVVTFEGGGTVELQPGVETGAFVEATVRIDYPIDDVILNRPVSPDYRYTRTVIRAGGEPQQDPDPISGSGDVLYLDVAR